MFSLTFDDISVDEFFTDKDNPNAILFCYEPDKEAKTNAYFHGLSECQSFDGFFFEFLIPGLNACLYILNYRSICYVIHWITFRTRDILYLYYRK